MTHLSLDVNLEYLEVGVPFRLLRADCDLPPSSFLGDPYELGLQEPNCETPSVFLYHIFFKSLLSRHSFIQQTFWGIFVTFQALSLPSSKLDQQAPRN